MYVNKCYLSHFSKYHVAKLIGDFSGANLEGKEGKVLQPLAELIMPRHLSALDADPVGL